MRHNIRIRLYIFNGLLLAFVVSVPDVWPPFREFPIYTGDGIPGRFLSKLSCQLSVSLAAGASSGNLTGSAPVSGGGSVFEDPLEKDIKVFQFYDNKNI